jgi:hypothetical protein
MIYNLRFGRLFGLVFRDLDGLGFEFLLDFFDHRIVFCDRFGLYSLGSARSQLIGSLPARIEAVDSSGGIYQLLFAGVERMAIGTDLNGDLWNRRERLNLVPQPLQVTAVFI